VIETDALERLLASVEQRVTPLAIRRIILERSYQAHTGHIGSALSIADIVAALFGGVMRRPGTDDPLRDRLVLSKGHAALALYAALQLQGLISEAELATYCQNGSLLEVHPNQLQPGIDFSTGSLGHGLSLGAGVALAARLGRDAYRAFVLLSDAELNEGSIWEAVMFAAHQRLSNLVAIVDLNGQQALGRTRDIVDLSPLGDRFRAFGWRVYEVDGHDINALRRTLLSLDTDDGAPHVVIARTVSGKGVGFMERRIEWHYFPMSDSEYQMALRELNEPASWSDA
jgi:transketolase